MRAWLLGNTEKHVRVSRQDLYAQVWAEPMTKVAERYHISDVGLKKRCKALEIPTPPRGYWAQVAQGMKPSIPPLKPGPGIPDFETFYLVPVVRDRLNVPSVVRPDDFTRPLHHLVQETVEILRDPRADYGRRQPTLNISVKHWRLERPAVLLSALFYAAERQGHEVAHRGFLVNGEEIRFHLTEELRYRPDPSWNGEGPKPPNEQVQALEFEFWLGQCPHEGRTKWKDTSKVPLEEQLDAILAELVPLSASLRPHRLKVEAQKAEHAENERRVRAAEDQLDTLKLDVQGYKFAEEVRSFVSHAERSLENRIEPERLSSWRKWALGIADKNDPLVARQDDPLAKYFRLHERLWTLNSEDV